VVGDATDIILNLKQVPIRADTDLPRRFTSTSSSPAQSPPAQIEEDADFAVLDKAAIATVSEGGSRSKCASRTAAVTLRRPLPDEDLPIGYIPVDSVRPCESQLLSRGARLAR
jgi:DNA-directed RNA polymerase subunit alpha